MVWQRARWTALAGVYRAELHRAELSSGLRSAVETATEQCRMGLQTCMKMMPELKVLLPMSLKASGSCAATGPNQAHVQEAALFCCRVGLQPACGKAVCCPQIVLRPVLSNHHCTCLLIDTGSCASVPAQFRFPLCCRPEVQALALDRGLCCRAA